MSDLAVWLAGRLSAVLGGGFGGNLDSHRSEVRQVITIELASQEDAVLACDWALELQHQADLLWMMAEAGYSLEQAEAYMAQRARMVS